MPKNNNRVQAVRQEFHDLTAGCDDKHLAVFLGVSPVTIRNWRAGRARVPLAVKRLLTLRLEGDLSTLAGADWEGFRICADGKFYHPFWSRGFTPFQLKALFFEVQDAWQLKRDLEQARAELAALKKEKARQRAGVKFWLVD